MDSDTIGDFISWIPFRLPYNSCPDIPAFYPLQGIKPLNQAPIGRNVKTAKCVGL